MAAWKDTTSYRKGERAPECPARVWSLVAGDIRVSIVWGHLYHPEKWIIRCAPFLDHVEIDGVPQEEHEKAKVHALRLLRFRLASAMQCLPEPTKD